MKSIYKILLSLAVVAALTLPAPVARAFDLSVFAEKSVLADGRWVKVSVDHSGVYHIPANTLKQWGFTDISKVRIHGYGGARMSDILSEDNYIDDLPATPIVATTQGIWFYAAGPETDIGPDDSGRFHRKLNPYTTLGYYYLTESNDAAPEIPVEGLKPSSDFSTATTFTDIVHHETDRTSPGETGHILLGEDFKYTPSRSFKLTLDGRVEGTDVNARIGFYTQATSSQPTLSIGVNGTNVATAHLPRTSSNAYGDSSLITTTFRPTGTTLNIDLSLSASGALKLAHLNYITLNYKRDLALVNGSLLFRSDSPALRLSGATEASTRVWDITDPQHIFSLSTTKRDNGVEWLNPFSGWRRYVAFEPTAGSFPAPTYVGEVKNQNIHGEETPDMIIVCPSGWKRQAERVANIHRAAPDNMNVLILDPDKIYNEFGSGSADCNALRRCFKMFYDRGNASGNRELRFVLLMSRAIYDHRHLTDYMQQSGWDNIPMWQTDAGSDDSYSYGSDDFMVMLADGSGRNISQEEISVSIGRMPVRNSVEAKTAVDKLYNYIYKSPEGDWKNRMVILADDQDNGIHLEQAENMISVMQQTDDGSQFLYQKVYLDAYEKIGGVTEGARTQMYKWLNEGAAWWAYIGHASIDTWTGEGVMTRTDIKDNQFFRRLPILYAATCSFARWDGSADSGMELMWLNESGGVIGGICPTRPVYISSNGTFSRQFASTIHKRDSDGRFLAIGDILRRSKNLGKNDANCLRFILMGDPAMRVPTPCKQIVLESIAGEPVDPENPPTIMARQQARMQGYITLSDGSLDPTFNGSLYLTLYDAEESVTTLGRGDTTDPGKECIFERQGTKLYSGRTQVVDGVFDLTVAMPSEIADNYRNAAVNMYAIDTSSGDEARGLTTDLYVYGTDPSAPSDSEGPEIRALYLNHESFVNGDRVNESPMLIANVADNISINMSQAGIGHSLLIKVDDADSYTDVSDFYMPESDGSPSGWIYYTLENLQPGNHTLEFRVWDTSNNNTRAFLDFYVEPGLTPEIFDIYTDVNPASTEVNFFVSHNRPDATLEVTIEVFDMMGRRMWSGSQRGRSDMFVSSPFNWNLTDPAGNRVARGLYIYRATVSTDGEQTASKAKRLAVTAR